MTFTTWLIIIIALGTVVSGILLLKQSARKFDLSDEQLAEIKKRNEALDKQEKEEDS